MDTANYKDQVVMVTGAASGFGKLLSERLIAMGAKLAICDLNEEGVNAVAESLRAQGGHVVCMPCDVSSELQVKAVVDAAVAEFGRLDIGVNNAGLGGEMVAFIDHTEAMLDQMFAVNAKGVFFGMKHQIKQMLTQGQGCILNVSSMAGLGGAPKIAAYSAAKHAVVGLTKTAAVEYGRKNIRVNAICPFFSLTPMVTDGLAGDPGVQEFLAQGSPMKRLGRPEEIVSTMLMICAPENSYLNGQTIAVDGGVSAF